MRPVQHTVRVPIALDKALRTLAERDGTSVYAQLQRCVKAGAATLAKPAAQDTSGRDIVLELASVGTRLTAAERLLDRVLFTACAAYGYARASALGLAEDDEAITAQVHAAYERQRRLARDEP
ncbi:MULTISPECIES: hypothetical protein [unclassified Novosphingobium]|uniref:hypothetical protein n=1 Tax=unclassified Novosphingobium TaxID=2644732 RepID=UPI00146C56A6|nr:MULTISPECIES: hypothetical protein [unclassified Novosphingobium]NMN06463.1 hypothetical protein [Novosphingobium sp. SG919]NMN89089.1 hypothetical protein [Novosphingobium sp. SG916]